MPVIKGNFNGEAPSQFFLMRLTSIRHWLRQSKFTQEQLLPIRAKLLLSSKEPQLVAQVLSLLFLHQRRLQATIFVTRKALHEVFPLITFQEFASSAFTIASFLQIASPGSMMQRSESASGCCDFCLLARCCPV